MILLLNLKLYLRLTLNNHCLKSKIHPVKFAYHPRDLLSGQSLHCDSLPDDKSATTLTPDSTTATKMAFAHPQETRWWVHQHLCLLCSMNPYMAQEERDNRESYTISILPLHQLGNLPFTSWDQKCCKDRSLWGSLWPTAPQPNDDDDDHPNFCDRMCYNDVW